MTGSFEGDENGVKEAKEPRIVVCICDTLKAEAKEELQDETHPTIAQSRI